MHEDGEPFSENCGHVELDGYYLTHAIWHNSLGSFQPETGVRTRAAGLRDFRLIEHGCADWPLVTTVTLAGLKKGWDAKQIAQVINRIHRRRRPRPVVA